MKWWGWGAPDIEVNPSPEFLHRIRDLLSAAPRQPVRERPALSAPRPVELPCRSANDDPTRLTFAGGRSYLDLIRLRSNTPIESADAVAFPQSVAEISAVLAAKNVAVVPFGGGTSVVGGVAPLRGG